MSTRMRLTRIIAQTRGGSKGRPKAAEVNAKEKKQWNILRGDRVQVLPPHPQAGKQGKILQVLRQQDRVIVEGIHMTNKNIKGDKERGIKGRTVQTERTIPYAQVSLVDPVTNQPTRIVKKFLQDGTKVRVAKDSGAVIPRPEILSYRKRPISSIVTDKDTSVEADVWEITYSPMLDEKKEP